MDGTPFAFVTGVTVRIHSRPTTPRQWQASAALSGLIGAVLLPHMAAPQVLPEPRTIDVSVRRYEFTPSTIDAHVGEHLRLRLTSEDRTHGFGVKALGVDVLVPRGGRTVVIEFAPPRPGVFEILCTEDCGRGHDDMKGTLVVKAVPK
jgi:cytochrome c oxidase subunit 2